jgi:hypothetical protein
VKSFVLYRRIDEVLFPLENLQWRSSSSSSSSSSFSSSPSEAYLCFAMSSSFSPEQWKNAKLLAQVQAAVWQCIILAIGFLRRASAANLLVYCCGGAATVDSKFRLQHSSRNS